jgi:thiol-disulfide isomerase/thioredoxin
LIAEIEPSQGTLAEQLKEHAAQAQALGLTAYVEFTATWCPACQAIKESLDDENELMVDAFQGTYIIPVDIDVWTEDDWVAAGFEIEFIPIYFEIDEAGQPTGENIGGDAWGDNIPENMAPPLKEFFQAHAAVR